MKDKISMRHGYTLSFDKDNTFCLKVDTEDGTIGFDGTALGNIYEASDFSILSDEKYDPLTMAEYRESATEFLTGFGVTQEQAEAIVEDLTPWFEKFAAEEVETEEPDAWEKVLIDRVRELEEKEQAHRESISKSVADFKKWVSTADEYSIIDNAEVRAKRVKDTRGTYRAVWKRLQEAKSELEQYREAMGR